MKKYLAALTNFKTLLAILGQIGIIVGVLAPTVDWDAVTIVLTAFFSILVYVGIVNKDGMDSTKWNK